MKLAHLSRTSPNKSSVGEVCSRLEKTFLTSQVGNRWSTGGLWVNSYSLKGGLIIFPLFLLEGNAILQMTPMAEFDIVVLVIRHFSHFSHLCITVTALTLSFSPEENILVKV